MRERQKVIAGVEWLIKLCRFSNYFKIHYYLMILIFMISPLINVEAASLDTSYPTDAEITALPPYCHAKLRAAPKSAEAKHWQQVLGKDYLNIHHLCQARALLMRANRMDNNRSYYLDNSMGNFDYMIKHSSKNFILIPEILYYKGYIFYKKRDYLNAIKFAKQAIRSNQKYIKPYLLLADVYLKQNDLKNAEDVLNKAKEIFPKSKAIKRRIKKLNNKVTS